MKTPHYLLVKYIPDLRRGEPRNVGVIVWTPEGLAARFIGERADLPGRVKAGDVPDFVTSAHAYRQWVEFFRHEVSQPVIEPATGGPPAAREDQEFLAALKTAGRGNYVVVDGGFLIDGVPTGQLDTLADHLFQTLVAVCKPQRADRPLRKAVRRLIEVAGLDRDSHFIREYPVEVELGNGATDPYQFDYAYKNGTLKRLYDELALPAGEAAMRKAVRDLAWSFEKVREAGLLPDVRDAVALVYLTDEQATNHEVRRMLCVLESVGRVLDVRNRNEAEQEFRSLPALAGRQ